MTSCVHCCVARLLFRLDLTPKLDLCPVWVSVSVVITRGHHTYIYIPLVRYPLDRLCVAQFTLAQSVDYWTLDHRTDTFIHTSESRLVRRPTIIETIGLLSFECFPPRVIRSLLNAITTHRLNWFIYWTARIVAWKEMAIIEVLESVGLMVSFALVRIARPYSGGH